MYFLEQAYRVLSRPDIGPSDLQMLLRLIDRAQREKLSQGDLRESIEREAPGLKPIADLMVPNDPGSFWAMLAVLASVIQILLNKPRRSTKRLDRKSRRAVSGPNASCPCGSGAKFKHCHGRSGTGSSPEDE
ncbi:hypothetical protein B1759_10540 [Rubrivirga sp. SAORIC476]|nr:hypothetical protein B1759_10540 [Rubrivirga sp. SAORIC476]